MRGSGGIRVDMQMAEHTARSAVTIMGMGAKTGVRHVDLDKISEKRRETVDADMEVLLKAGKKISDAIIAEYKDFILEFSEKYYSKVGTGECLITSKEFIAMLNEWRGKQTPEKQLKLSELESQILQDLKECKEGKI
jgi:hypothetical protein